MSNGGRHSGSGIFGGFYFMGFIVAAIYFIQNAEGAGAGFIGFLKAIVWPAFLIYNLMNFLQM